MPDPVRPQPWFNDFLTGRGIVADATRVARLTLPNVPTIGPTLEPMAQHAADRLRAVAGLEQKRHERLGLLADAAEAAAQSNIPGLSDIASAGLALKDLAQGNFGSAGLGAIAALPIIPRIKSMGKRAASNTGKAALAQVDFRAVPGDEALAMARRGEHLRQMPDGQYVGAPQGVNSGAQLGARRRAFDDLVEGGEQGLDWYPRARAAVVEMAGPDAIRQRQTARSLGNFSSQANPDVNLGFHLQAHNAYEAGVPRDVVRTGAQARKYNSARDAGTDIKLGPKQEPYVNKFDPTQDPNHIPTNDIWHGRSWGFENPNGSPWSGGYSGSQHTWLDGETILAADRANRKNLLGHNEWDAASVQAAPWVYLKGMDLHRKFPKRFPTLQSGVAEAAKSYGDAIPKYTAFATHEAVPGAGTGHLPGLLDATFDERKAFGDASTWADTYGRDVLYDATGFHQRSMQDATGYFTPEGGLLEINPASVSRPLVDLTSDAGGPAVSDVSKSVLGKAEGLRAYLDAQNMGAWHKTIPNAKASVSSSARIPLSRALTEGEMRALAPVAEQHGFGVSDTGEGVTLMNFGGGPADGQAVNRALKGELGASLSQIFPEASAARARLESGAVDFQDAFQASNAGQGQATRQLLGLLDDPASPAIAQKLGDSPAVRAKAAGNLERDAAAAGRYGPVRDDIQNARRIFAQEGVEGLRRALAAGMSLPVIMAAMAGPAGLLSDEADE